MKMEDLKFPLFTTTAEEKKVLRGILDEISKSEHQVYLCTLLEFQRSEEAWSIRNKIKSFSGYILEIKLDRINSESVYLCEDYSYKDLLTHNKLRLIWINKLLTYSGE